MRQQACCSVAVGPQHAGKCLEVALWWWWQRSGTWRQADKIVSDSPHGVKGMLSAAATHLDKPNSCCCRRLAILLLHRPCKGGVMQQQPHQRLHPRRLHTHKTQSLCGSGSGRPPALHSTLLLTCMGPLLHS